LPGYLPPDCCDLEPPCFNEGRFCMGNGQCNGTDCVCTAPSDSPDCTPSTPECKDVKDGDSCETCLENSRLMGLNCTYCPNNATDPDLTQGGKCVESTAQCTLPLYTCQEEVPTTPPACADNCSTNGKCVNVTYCDELDRINKEKYGNDTTKYEISCGNNSALARGYNQTGACACFPGFSGFNCALGGSRSVALIAALSAGLIALIVLMALLGAAVAGGGAVAVSSGVASTSDATVMVSPIYEGSNASGANPLFSADYELM